MSKRTWIIFVVVVIALLGGLVAWSRIANPGVDVSNVDLSKVQTANEQNGNIADHTFGKATSAVTLVEYGDFQCPVCGAAHPQIQAISDEYKDKIAFIFRNLPLKTVHPNANAAATAAEAAGLQGKYWEMHNLLFDEQDRWSTLGTDERTDVFKQYASDIGIDADKFVTALSSSAVKQKLAYDLALFKKTGYQMETPIFVVNGERVSADISKDAIQGNGDLLRELLDSKL
ncbi:MAG: hypothetical protein JWN33_74 [Candidatus Saccharibacteria bacterium]|nr:hypothetical protein [Candidatus Saccharibacteria bacterium]